MFVAGIQKSAVLSAADITQGRVGFSVGDVVSDHQGNALMFVQASGTVAQYDVVAADSTGVAQAITSTLATAGGFIGVAQAALSSGEYGFAQLNGVTTMNVLSTCSAGVALYTSATAGKLDDTSTSQVKIASAQLVANATTAGGYATLLVARPFAAI